MSIANDGSLNHYCCFLLGSRYWFLEILFRRPKYIVFPNLSLSTTEDLNLRGFSRNRRALCFIYDTDLQSFVGVIRCLDVALAMQLDEFYKEKVYGVTVPTEWFWDKWGGVGIGVITTKPSYIHKLQQHLSVDELTDIATKASEESLVKGIRELVEETRLSGFAIATIANVYKLFQVLQSSQRLSKHRRQVSLQQIEIANMLTDIGSKLGYKVSTSNINGGSTDIVWIDKDIGKIVKVFRVCSAKKLAKMFKNARRKRVDDVEYWITLYDVEYGSEYAKNVSSLARLGLDTNVVSDTIKIIGWKEVFDVYKVVLGIGRKILAKS